MRRSRLAILFTSLAALALACEMKPDPTKQCRQAATDAQCASCCKDNGSTRSHFGGAMGTCGCD